MKIKSYTAESVAEALKLVRQEMGADAFVLKTRRLTNGRGRERVEVTACTEQEIVVEESQKTNGNSNRLAAITNEDRVNTTPSGDSSETNELSDIKRRLDSIDKKLAAIILQMNEIRQN